MALIDDIVNVVDKVTAFPGKVAQKADEVNDRVISIARDLEAALAASGEVAEQNLRQNKIESLGRDAASWLSKPRNMVIAGIGAGVLLVLLILGIRRL